MPNSTANLAAGTADSGQYRQMLPETSVGPVAAYFHVLGEPTRLQILNLLQQGEHSVGGLAEAIGCSAANTSRHLSLMARHGLICRNTRGNLVFYRISDPHVRELCCRVCTHLTPGAACCQTL
ncbi:MAG TPA: transcriptional regulator [Oceanospirillales bacterium]|nr:transcriptional regulator [Oceanospirillaceae bacterium]HBS42712.1 transcriptional regulator [Oceanospirillales bacterium]|tara:strand:- start:868 stop:1236 length:369 start_codon:yes stop_codon:yes gene_type:complete